MSSISLICHGKIKHYLLQVLVPSDVCWPCQHSSHCPASAGSRGKEWQVPEWQLLLGSIFPAKLNPEPRLCSNSTMSLRPNFPNTDRIPHFKMSMVFLLPVFHKQTNSKLFKALYLLKNTAGQGTELSTFSPHIPTPSSRLFNKNRQEHTLCFRGYIQMWI